VRLDGEGRLSVKLTHYNILQIKEFQKLRLVICGHEDK